MPDKQKPNRAELFEFAPQAMVLLDAVGQIIQFNQRFSALFGYQPEALADQAIEFVLPTYPLCKPTSAGQDSPTFTLDLAGKHKDNRSIPLKVIGKRLAIGEGAHLLLSLYELAEDPQAETATNQLRYQLVEWWVNERRQLARQIHKGALQEIQGLNFFLAALTAAPDFGDEVKHESALIRASVQSLAQEVRQLQQELFPPTLADFGVTAAIRSYAKDLQGLYPALKIQLKLAEESTQLPLVRGAILFYNCKQALLHLIQSQPGITHEVQITLQIDAEAATLEISDDGDRFDVPAQWITITDKEHLGLISAIKCAEALGGQCTTRSASPKGSMLCITMPIESQP